MNAYMEQVAESVFSSFDGGEKPSARPPERFYHGFVLGLLLDLRGRYEVLSNRESGFGRYDMMLKPLNGTDDGNILEFIMRPNHKLRRNKFYYEKAKRIPFAGMFNIKMPDTWTPMYDLSAPEQIHVINENTEKEINILKDLVK